MKIGFILWGPDNGSVMFSDTDKLTKPEKCVSCGYRVDYEQTNNLFRIKRKVYDLSFTYDGIAIASLRFKEFCNRNNYSNIIFKELERSFGFYQLIIKNNTVPFSANLTEDYCNACRQFRTVVDYKVKTENFKEPFEEGFYQSDLKFGGRLGKHDSPLNPIIVVAPITQEKMQNEKLRGLTFEPIEV